MVFDDLASKILNLEHSPHSKLRSVLVEMSRDDACLIDDPATNCLDIACHFELEDLVDLEDEREVALDRRAKIGYF